MSASPQLPDLFDTLPRPTRGGAGLSCAGLLGGWVSISEANRTLAEHHYLGPVKHGIAWKDQWGVIVFANPRSRRLPLQWLELIRWCIVSPEKNAGSRQFARVRRELVKIRRDATTIVSYSDPSQGHTGALYRACNWWWAPTWQRLRPPPTGNGQWTDGKRQEVKDRWVFPLRKDPARPALLIAKDESILRAHPEWTYTEPGGVRFDPPND